jgi:hypothetical protein
MPTPTYTPLANTTLVSATGTVTFSSINQGYRDLILVSNVLQNTTAARQSTLRPNGDSGNATLVYMDGSGSSTASGSVTSLSMFYVASGPAANITATSIMNIMDYSATDKHKTILTRAGTSYDPVSAYASRWASTSAITSLDIVATTGGNFSAGSSFALYGVIA